MSYETLKDYDDVLNEGTEDELHYKGYCRSCLGQFLYWLLAVVTGGTSILFLYWKPALRAKLINKPCDRMHADTLILQNKYDELFVVHVCKIKVSQHFPKEYTYSSLGSSGYGSFNSYDHESGSDLHTEAMNFKYFIHHHVRYTWDQRKRKFFRLRGYDVNVPCKDILEDFHGLAPEQQIEKRILYGENSIDVEVKSYIRLFFEEVMHPFYIFQIFSIILWYTDDYATFSTCILLITSVSMAISLYEMRKQSKTLHNMVSSLNDVLVTVMLGDGSVVEMPSNHLVPGDVIVIPSVGCIMSCDAVLTAGTCIVNESMLTGESVPVMKTQLPLQDDQYTYSPDIHKRHTLFCGTNVIQTRFYGNNKVTAFVVRTGFLTAKGELVRSILFPRPLGFKFYKDSMRFIGVLFFIALLGIAYSLYVFIIGQFSVKRMIIRVLDIVTIVVPPSLPAAMTVGTVYAQSRLKKKEIFCISPPRINVSGKLKLFCFDKTGTLTEEGLDLWGVVPVENRKFDSAVRDPKTYDPKSALIAAMATCHSLTRIEGELKGDPLDLKMFEATDWVLEEPGEDTTRYDMLLPTIVRPAPLNKDADDFFTELPFEIGIVRQFTFSSTLQRMSVITRTLGKKHMDVYIKGAPEKIVTLCYPETVPDNFLDQLERYTVKGYRVIALAWRSLEAKLSWHQVQRIKRDDVERDLEFLGLLILRNTLKPETTPVINELTTANIRTVMITGDNMHTAVCVARECGMVSVNERIVIVDAHPPEENAPANLKMVVASSEGFFDNNVTDISINADIFAISIDDPEHKYHFCMSGRSFGVIQQYFPDLVQKYVVRGTIFARMSPENKTQLVKEFQQLGYTVGMCGDGANDCGALRAADVGISLSDAEASVAAPFTSKVANIECVPNVIKEGRCALVTSFGVFKYMALYSIIQFVSVLIMYWFKTNLGDQQFLYIDLALATIMAIVMSYTKSYDVLVSERPQGSLVSASVMVSVITQIMLATAAQVLSLLFLQQQPWYVKAQANPEDEFKTCWEATVIFGVSNFQYVITATVFSTGPPFRQPFFTNGWMVLSIIIFTAINFIFLLHPFEWLATLFQINVDERPSQFTFRLWLVTLVLSYLLISVMIELITNSNAFRNGWRRIKRKKRKSGHYKTVEYTLNTDTSWPIMNQIMFSHVPV